MTFSRSLLGAAVIGCVLVSVQAYPTLFEREFAQSCTDHPNTGFGGHGAPANDMNTAFSLISSSAASPTPVSSVCPGYTYQVSIDYGGIPRNTLLTSSIGTLKSSTDNACPNRATGMSPTPIYNDEISIPCDAKTGSTLELKVTSAARALDNFHQASATYPISTLNQCPQTTCKATTATAAAAAQGPAQPAKTLLSATSSPPPAVKPSAPDAVITVPANATANSNKSKDALPATPAPGLGLLAKILNMTNSAQSAINKSAPAIAAAAGPAVAAAVAAGARVSPAPGAGYRRAAGDFPILSRWSTAATDLEKQLQTSATKLRSSSVSNAPGTVRTPVTSAAISGGPVFNGFLRAADGAAQNLTQITRSANNTARASNSTPIIDALRRLGNRGYSAGSGSGAMLGAGSGLGAVTGAGNQWQPGSLLQSLQKALQSGVRVNSVQAADKPTMQASNGVRQQVQAAPDVQAANGPALASLLAPPAHNVELDTP